MTRPLVPLAVIFDLNGTVVDDTAAQRAAWQHTAASWGVTVTDEDYATLIAGRRQRDVVASVFGPVDVAEFDRIVDAKQYRYRRHDPPGHEVPGFGTFVEDLRRHGVPVALASSSSVATLDFLLDELDLRRHFDAVVRSDDVTRGKPDPEIYLAAAARVATAPRHCVAFEDAVTGVLSAKGAGMVCVGLSTGSSPEELYRSGADRVEADFRALDTAVVRSLREVG